MYVKQITESVKPKGITYTYACGHGYFMSADEVYKFVYNGGSDAPKTCPTCSKEA